jgi:phage terminase large subunit-like protein
MSLRQSSGHDVSRSNPVTRYALAVQAGRIIAGWAVRAACTRHLRDLKDGPARGLRFDRAALERVLKFFGLLCHYEGATAGQRSTSSCC